METVRFGLLEFLGGGVCRRFHDDIVDEY